MDQETLFTASKWDILKLLSEQPLSPIEIAAKSNTSVANVSQQLRLLEMAGLVRSERISNRDKGLPRILYSLAGNHSYLIATTNDFVDKKMLKLSAYNRIILRIWFYERHDLHYFLEKAFWSMEPMLDKIDALALDQSVDAQLAFVVFTRDGQLKDRLKPFAIKGPEGQTKQATFIFTHPDKEKQERKALYMLYDPANVLSRQGEGKNPGARSKGD